MDWDHIDYIDRVSIPDTANQRAECSADDRCAFWGVRSFHAI